MTDYWPGYLEYSDHIQVMLIRAEFKRMQRTDDEAQALYRHLARQRVRFIIRRLVSR